MITVKNLNFSLGEQKILRDLTCIIQKGTITSFIGKSGAGKTTLLKGIAGLYSIPEHSIFLQNKDIAELSETERYKKIGFVFQSFNLFPHMTVLENCIDPLLIQKKSTAQAKAIAQEKLQLLGILDFADKYPAQLSGGQQQRLAIARALVLNPEIVMLDEPTASLDPINTDRLVTILKNLVKNGITVAVSSQDMSFVSKIFDSVYFMQDGKIVEYSDDSSNLEKSPLIKSFLKS
jgi:ABC-type polar amino acid transport system ATPase subunit